MKLDNFKYICAAIIAVSTVIGIIIPVFVRNHKWTSRMEAGVGGVFLGAGFAHLLADSFSEIAQTKIDYPLAAATCVATFIFLTLVDLFSFTEKDASAGLEPTNAPPPVSIPSSPSSSPDIHMDELGSDHSSNSDSHHDENANSGLNNEETHALHVEQIESAEKDNEKESLFSRVFQWPTMPTVTLFITMGIHSTVSGLALGILGEWGSVIAVLCAIVGHKPLEAFALGLIVLRCRPTTWFYWLMMAFYCLLTPIGIIVGIVIRDMSGHLALGVVEAFSAGTFIFCGCNEWLAFSENKPHWDIAEKLWHIILFAIGALWMLLIALLE